MLQYVTIEINDSTNPYGYVILVGLLLVGFTPKYNPEYGLQDSWEDKTEIVELASGATQAVNKALQKSTICSPWLFTNRSCHYL